MGDALDPAQVMIFGQDAGDQDKGNIRRVRILFEQVKDLVAV